MKFFWNDLIVNNLNLFYWFRKRFSHCIEERKSKRYNGWCMRMKENNEKRKEI